jgi:hypothetical protein
MDTVASRVNEAKQMAELEKMLQVFLPSHSLPTFFRLSQRFFVECGR